MRHCIQDLFLKYSTYALGYWPNAFVGGVGIVPEDYRALAIITIIALSIITIVNFLFFIFNEDNRSKILIPSTIIYICFNVIFSFAFPFFFFNILGLWGFIVGGVVLVLWYIIKMCTEEEVCGIFGVLDWVAEIQERYSKSEKNKKNYLKKYNEYLKF